MLHLIPSPKKIKEEKTVLKSRKIQLVSEISEPRLQKAIAKLPLSQGGIPLEIFIGDGQEEAYTLEVAKDRITLNAQGEQGAFYGIQTLRQIFTHEEIPCLSIEDAPDFGYRGFYHDVTRGKVPKVETIKELIDKLAYYKMNSLQLYVEHAFAFEEYADSIERTGYLSAEEIREIDDYCYENFIEFIPSLSCFGHLYELLQKERYQELREIEDFQQEQVFWMERMQHHTIDPTNPKSIELIQHLLDQYMPLFRSDKFNICCDETFDLKIGRHWNLDTGKLYVNFVKQIIDYVQSKGKTVMMWADIVLEHPDILDDLPDDIQFLNWCYDPGVEEKNIAVFQKVNRSQIVCPGTSSWWGMTELIAHEELNISEMTELGFKHGAVGVLNTNWGDFGNPCSLELAMYGMAFGAEKSWSVATKPDERFRASVNHLLYENRNAYGYIRALGNLQKQVVWKAVIQCYNNLLYSKKLEIQMPKPETVQAVQEGCTALMQKLGAEQWKQDAYRKELLIAAEGIMVTAELLAKIAGYSIKRRTDTHAWLKKYREAWCEKNKESELKEIEKIFLCLENYGLEERTEHVSKKQSGCL